MQPLTSLQLKSLITPEGKLRLWLDETAVREPQGDEVVVEIEASPLNPSDIYVLLGPVDMASLRSTGSASRPAVEGAILPAALSAIQARVGLTLPIGNEASGKVVRAGEAAAHLVGRRVALRAPANAGTYASHVTVPASSYIVVPEGVSASQSAGLYINPLTALGMVETMKSEGHHAIVHTAAASSLGQMLNRLCEKEGIPLVNIVRSEEQRALLQRQGAKIVLNSREPDFLPALKNALVETGATLAFEAIGGGDMASILLTQMEAAAASQLTEYRRYGSSVRKQVYSYGLLDPSPIVLHRNGFGFAWNIGGWLLTNYLASLTPAAAERLKAKALSEITTTFATEYSKQLSFEELLTPESLRAIRSMGTGQKVLLTPTAPASRE